MSKTLKEMLFEMPAEAGLRLNHLAKFLALQSEIEDALNSGWTAKAVWHLLYQEEKFTGRYDCFLKYVNKYIKNKISTNGKQETCTSTMSNHDSNDSHECKLHFLNDLSKSR